MTDTERSEAELLTIFADGQNGGINAQDMRDFVVSVPQLSGTPNSTDEFSSSPGSALYDPETTTGWVGINTGNVQAPGTSTDHTLGTKSVTGGFGFVPGQDTRIYYNPPTPWARSTQTHVAFDFRWNWNGTSQTWRPHNLAEFFAASGADMTGTVITRFVGTTNSGDWNTMYIDVSSLSQIGSIGARLRRDVDLRKFAGWDAYNGLQGWTFKFDNFRWAAQTQLDAAMTSSGFGIASPDYVAGVTQIPVAPSGVILDVRAGHSNLSGVGGVRNVRDWKLDIEDGSVDSTALLDRVFKDLRSGDTLEFPPGAVYRLDSGGIGVSNLHDVTIDGRGARLYSTVESATGMLSISNCRRTRLRNIKINNEWIEDLDGTHFTVNAGTPTVAASATLGTQNDELLFSRETRYARDHEDAITFSLTLSDTAQVSRDCLVEMIDSNAPPAPTVTASGTTGAVVPGTYYYRVTYEDANGQQTGMGPPASITLANADRVNLTNISVGGRTSPSAGLVVSRTIWRTKVNTTDEQQNYYPVGMIRNNTATTFVDAMGETDDHLNAPSTATDAGAGNVPEGETVYVVTAVNSTTHRETIADPGRGIVLYRDGQVALTGIPLGAAGTTSRRIYRRLQGLDQVGPGNVGLVGEIMDNTTTTFTDNVAEGSLGQDASWLAEKGYGPPVLLPTMTLTLTSSPQVYDLRWTGPTNLGMEPTFIVRKLTATANTITVANVRTRGRIVYHSSVETGHGISLANNAADIIIEDCAIEGVRGDAISTVSSDVGEVRDVTIRRVLSRGCGRQGMAFTYGTRIRLEDSTIRDTPRSGIDMEPEIGDIAENRDITFDRVTLANITNGGFQSGGGNSTVNVRLSNCTILGAPGQGGINGKFDRLDIRNVKADESTVTVHGNTVVVDGLSCGSFALEDKVSGGFGGIAVDYAILNNITANRVSVPAGLNWVGNVNIRRGITVGASGPAQSSPDARYAMIDPGAYADAYPTAFPGVAAGPLVFPRGQNMFGRGMVQAGSLSATATSGNNLSGVGVAVVAGATTKTIAFAAKSCPSPTGLDVNATGAGVGGSLLPSTTYYYKVAARTLQGGPGGTATAEKSRLTAASGAGSTGNVVQLQGIPSAPDLIEAVTVYRGTTSGVYTTRFDVVPNQDLHFLAYSGGNNHHDFLDYGSTFRLNSTGGDVAFGYPLYTSPTSTSGHTSWTGSAWTVQNETGWEPDTSYAVVVETSWNTTWWITAKRRNGFDISFGTAAPGGGGTVSWVIVR